jgi:heptosyltransferase I
MLPLFTEPPRSVLILKLSALGDICHTLPVIRTLQRAWPSTQFTWVLGRTEAKFIGGIPEIEFIEFDKRAGWAGRSAVRRALGKRAFDLLLHMQFAWRASQLAATVRARIKLGYDRERALDLQWLFTSDRIEAVAREHVMDGLFGFARRCGVTDREYRWDIPVPDSAREYAHRVIPDGMDTLIISPCSSHPSRNWNAAGYAAVADHAVRNLGLRAIICGGQSELEQQAGKDIAGLMREHCTNLVGQDTLLEFYATLGRARVLLTPDSGPAHMATSLGIPVVGLYAATNPARSGPYFSLDLCASQFGEAARQFRGKAAEELPWRTKIERAGVMDLIQPTQVIERLNAAMARPDGLTSMTPPLAVL